MRSGVAAPVGCTVMVTARVPPCRSTDPAPSRRRASRRDGEPRMPTRRGACHPQGRFDWASAGSFVRAICARRGGGGASRPKLVVRRSRLSRSAPGTCWSRGARRTRDRRRAVSAWRRRALRGCVCPPTDSLERREEAVGLRQSTAALDGTHGWRAPSTSRVHPEIQARSSRGTQPPRVPVPCCRHRRDKAPHHQGTPARGWGGVLGIALVTSTLRPPARRAQHLAGTGTPALVRHRSAASGHRHPAGSGPGH